MSRAREKANAAIVSATTGDTTNYRGAFSRRKSKKLMIALERSSLRLMASVADGCGTGAAIQVWQDNPATASPANKKVKRVYLLTGGPGVGKTTIIRRALDRTHLNAGGFFTEEIKAGGTRQGFRIVTMDGQSAILSHIDIKARNRVGKYGVDTENLDRVGVSALQRAIRDCDIVVIDEIGKMELFSPNFKKTVLEALSSGKRVLGTIMLAPHPWADEIKRNPGVATVTVTRENRDEVFESTLNWLDERI